jgi:hypothetical protein
MPTKTEERHRLRGHYAAKRYPAGGLRRLAKRETGVDMMAEVRAVDYRTAQGKRFSQLTSALISDAGGPDKISTMKLLLVHRAAAAATVLEQIEAQALAGEKYNLAEMGVLSNIVLKCARLLGTARTPHDLPSLESYLQSLSERGRTDDGESAAELEEVAGVIDADPSAAG